MQPIFRPRNSFLFCTLIIFLALFTSAIHAQTVLPGQWTGTFITSSTNLSDTKIRTLLVNGTKVLAGTSTGVWQTTDNGVTWTQVNTGLTFLDVRALALSGTTLYAGTSGGGVFKSTDGTNWTVFNTGLTNLSVTSLAANSTDVYAGTNGGGVFLSTSGGNWATANKTISASARVTSLFLNGSDLYAGGTLIINDAHHIFKTSDKGTTWKATGATTVTTSNNPPEQVYSIAASGTNLLAATIGGLYRSTDSGATWQLMPGLPLPILNLAVVSAKSAIYAAAANADGTPFGVLVSTDNGTTWRATSYNLAGANSLAATDTTLFAGSATTYTISTTTIEPITNASVSAANFLVANGHAPESIASLFGPNLATGRAFAVSTPLPTTLLGTTITFTDSAGTSQLAPLFFVDKNQINYQIPANAALGWAYLTIKTGDNVTSYATANITSSAFGLISADSTGTGVPAAYAQRIRANGSQSFEAVGRFDATTQKWVTTPIDLGPEGERVYLVLFGTGIRGWNATGLPVNAYFGDNQGIYVPMQADYAGAHGTFIGVDQVNLLIPRSLAGKGAVTLYITGNGGTFSNTVNINIF